MVALNNFFVLFKVAGTILNNVALYNRNNLKPCNNYIQIKILYRSMENVQNYP